MASTYAAGRVVEDRVQELLEQHQDEVGEEVIALNAVYEELLEVRIVAAALRVGGKIHTGRSHGEIAAKFFGHEDELDKAEDGFVTDRGDFVNRHTAVHIARHANQLMTGADKHRLDSYDVKDRKTVFPSAFRESK